MKILCVCDEGVNRSVHIASVLQYLGHETIPVGVNRSSPETREMLADWCDAAIFTDASQHAAFPGVTARAHVWPIPDVYPRPFNKAQHEIVKRYIKEGAHVFTVEA